MWPQYCILDTSSAVYRMERRMNELQLIEPSMDQIGLLVVEAFASATEDRLHTLGDVLTVFIETNAPESLLSSLYSVENSTEAKFHRVLEQARNNENRVRQEYQYVAELIYQFGVELDKEYTRIGHGKSCLPYCFRGWVNRDISLAFDPHAGSLSTRGVLHVDWRR